MRGVLVCEHLDVSSLRSLSLLTANTARADYGTIGLLFELDPPDARMQNDHGL